MAGPALTGAQANLAPAAEDVAYVIEAFDLLTGWGDIDNDPLSVQYLAANHGATVNNGNGTFTLTLTTNYSGPVTLSYGVSDGTTTTATTINLNVAPVAETPSLALAAYFANGPDINANTSTSSNHRDVEIAALPNGGFVATWRQCLDGVNFDVFARVFDATGAPAAGSANDILVSTSSFADQGGQQIAALSKGKFVVTWKSHDNGSNSDIRARLFNSDRAPAANSAADVLVSTTNMYDQVNAQVAALANGGFVVAWQSADNGDDSDIRARHFNADGTPAGGSASDILISTTNDNGQFDPKLAALANGGFAAIWRSFDTVSGFQIRGRMFDADGAPVSRWFLRHRLATRRRQHRHLVHEWREHHWSRCPRQSWPDLASGGGGRLQRRRNCRSAVPA